ALFKQELLEIDFFHRRKSLSPVPDRADPSPQPPPRNGEGEQRKDPSPPAPSPSRGEGADALPPPLRFGEGAGGRGFSGLLRLAAFFFLLLGRKSLIERCDPMNGQEDHVAIDFGRQGAFLLAAGGPRRPRSARASRVGPLQIRGGARTTGPG